MSESQLAQPTQLGVTYTPSADPQPPTFNREQDISDFIQSHCYNRRIGFIRIQWVDLINNIRYRIVPVAYFAKLLKSARPGVSLIKSSLGLIFLAVADGFGPIGEYIYAIDLSSFRRCGFEPRHASVMGWFQEKTPPPGRNGSLLFEVDLCPRTILRRVAEKSKLELGLDFLVGVESEFILLKSTNPIEAVNNHGWSNSPALPSGSVEAKVLEEIADALGDAGVELQMYHAEAAPGQYEVVTGPLAPLQAADALVHTRETIYNIASKHGLRATFALRVYMDSCGSAAHTHISVHSKTPSPNSPESPNLTTLEASFLTGILEHLPALMILTLPLKDSYKRMADGAWSGGTYVCWGTDNREAPVRLCNATSPSSRNFEIKAVDGTSNPYLAIAGLLAAGVDGIRMGRQLEMGDCGAKTAALMEERERLSHGITTRLPLTRENAREIFADNVFLRAEFGEEFITKYLSVNKTLKEKMNHGYGEREALRFLVQSYLPLTREKAREAFADDAFLRAGFGEQEEFITKYLSVNKTFQEKVNGVIQQEFYEAALKPLVETYLPLTREKAREALAGTAFLGNEFEEEFITKYLSVSKTLREKMDILSYGISDGAALKLLVETY